MSKKTPLRLRLPTDAAPPVPNPATPVSLPADPNAARWPWAVLALTLLFLVGVRLRLLDVPLERDEGGFAYIGKMMFEGQNLYTDLYDSKLPGLYALYGAFVHLFGYSASGVHFGLLLCNATATVLLFFLGKKLYDAGVAAWAVAVFALMSTSLNVLGFAAHATQLLLPFVLAALWLLARELERPGLRPWAVLLAGGLLSLAFLVKQQAVFFMPLAALWLWFALRERGGDLRLCAKSVLLLAAGAVLPFAVVAAYMAAAGRFGAFWFWTYELPGNLSAAYGTGEKLGLFVGMTRVVMRSGHWALWLLAALGLVALWRSAWGFSRKIFATFYPLLTFGAVLMGAAYYPHYWVLMLPGVALLAGLMARHLSHKPLIVKVMSGLLLLVMLWAFGSNAAYYLSDDHTRVLRRAYTANPFPECAAIGAELKKRSVSGDEMLVFGAEPELLVSSGLPSVTGHIFPYHLLDGQPYNTEFQHELLKSVYDREPRFVAVFTGGTSWLFRDVAAGNHWIDRLSAPVFDNPKYRRICIVDIFNNKTVMKWDGELVGFKPSSKAQIWVYEHNGRRTRR